MGENGPSRGSVPPLPVARLVKGLRRGGPTLVALSGGVDSAVVAALTARALPGKTHSATLAGPATAADEVRRARAVAAHLGIPHSVLEVDPLGSAEYRANPPNRCYFCRRVEASVLQAHGRKLGLERFLDGVHRDDLGDDRPGLRALAEAGFEHPLLEAGWGKAEVRSFARRLGLPNWDAPSDSCLASRIPHGVPIDAAALRRIEAAEAWLKGRGYRRVRVRLDADGARIEVGPEEVPRLTEPSERSIVSAALRPIGFAHVAVDPRGYALRANS